MTYEAVLDNYVRNLEAENVTLRRQVEKLSEELAEAHRQIVDLESRLEHSPLHWG
jgi:uncharacterized protein involved in exopolysaccharide biosynthesis